MNAVVFTREQARRATRYPGTTGTVEGLRREPGAELAVVIPTYCERGNVTEVIRRLRSVLAGISWEAVFVDDDSPDGTARVVRAIGRRDSRVRCVQRIGRRGLSGACIEGMLASSAPLIAVMDADLQHDEAVLPKMLSYLREGSAELVVATRYDGTGSVGEWSASRARISSGATRLSQLVYEHPVSDPMSGFFMLRRGLLEESMRELSTAGFKLLLDILATIKRPIAIKEVAYTFRSRVEGESKLDTVVAWDFGMLVLDKLIGRYVPMRFVAFSLVGGAGILVHLAMVTLLLGFTGMSFPEGQAVAATVTMVFNYAVNNVLTYRDRRRRRLAWLTGLGSFMVACSLGALANVTIAAAVYARHAPWMLASLAGIIVGAVWNYAMTSRFTWGSSKAAR
jgi:dolichol-phosphate mannosyltransferase